MSTFAAPLVRVGGISKHADADTLSVTHVEGFPVIIRTGDLTEGDLAVYIPGEAVISQAPWVSRTLGHLKFKNGKHRVKAVRLRGMFSMGILVPFNRLLDVAPFGTEVGSDCASWLGIEKYEEPIRPEQCRKLGGQQERDPGLMPIYGVENYRKFRHVFAGGVEVVVTEKIHGCNARFVHDGERLWVGSHRTWKKLDSESVWNEIAVRYGLAEKLAQYPMVGIFGEVFGDVQDLKYGLQRDQIDFRMFDVYDVREGKFRPWSSVEEMATALGLQTVPVLYKGPFNAALIEPMADGDTTFGAGQIREGIVIKTTNETFNDYTGRTIAKLVSEHYLLRKNATEHH